MMGSNESGVKKEQRQEVQNEMQAKGIVSALIKKVGSVKGAFEEFNEQSQSRLDSGKVPNALFPNAAGIFTQIVPLEENLMRIESAKTVVKDKVLDNIIYDITLQINSHLQENVLELPDVEQMDPGQEVVEYEQALIQVFNHVPNVKDDKKRQDLIWMGNLLNEMIGNIKASG